MFNSGKNCTQTLFYEAKQYQTRGWSVIPLLGGVNLHDLKRPAIKWGRYQHALPEVIDLENWFLESGFGGLGIVCGRVSGLAVLDFDDPQKASEFLRLHPHLTQTRVVESGTRHLPHYYYHVPGSLSVHTRSAPGVDFRADGAYVVAPPTGYGDVQWRVLKDAPLYTLSQSDLKAIWRFMASSVPESLQNRLETPSQSNLSHPVGRVKAVKVILETGSKKCSNPDTSLNDLLVLYRTRTVQGRNNALFQVTCLARDRGMPKSIVIQKLASVHASQPGHDGLSETFDVRYAEALRTIESVYKRLARQSSERRENKEGVGIPTPSGSGVIVGLLNSVREWLLKNSFTAAARVLDGLLLVGFEARSLFTERQACELLESYGIGRRSIMVALKTLLPDGQPLFEKVANPLHTSPTSADAATNLKTEQKECDLVRGANRVKTSGRPAAYYRLPDNETLARRIGVKITSADSINMDDLASPKQYRRAMHRELIKRRPGSYSRDWLSDRLGISKWTTRRYDASLNVIVHPIYIEQSIRWANVESLLPRTIEDAPQGTFLETDDGKRYPPLRALAFHLLDIGRKIVHKTRIANQYSLHNSEGVGIPTPSVPDPTPAHASPVLTPQAIDSYSHSTPLTYNRDKETDTIDQSKIAPLQEAVGIPTPSTSDTRPSFWLCPSCLKTHISVDLPASCPRCSASAWERVPDAIWHNQERLKIFWQTRWREKHPSALRHATPLVDIKRRRNSDASQNAGVGKTGSNISDNERAAQQVHEAIPDLGRINALRLIKRYGRYAVEDALARLKCRSGIRNPAGFLISLLNSENLFYKGEKATPCDRQLESAAEWIQQMAESAYVEFLSNANEFRASVEAK